MKDFFVFVFCNKHSIFHVEHLFTEFEPTTDTASGKWLAGHYGLLSSSGQYYKNTQ